MHPISSPSASRIGFASSVVVEPRRGGVTSEASRKYAHLLRKWGVGLCLACYKGGHSNEVLPREPHPSRHRLIGKVLWKVLVLVLVVSVAILAQAMLAQGTQRGSIACTDMRRRVQ